MSVTDVIKSNEKKGEPLYQNQKVTIVFMLLLIGTLLMSFLSSHTSVNIHHADEGDIILFGIFYMLICIMWPQLTIKENLSTYFNWDHKIICMLLSNKLMFLSHLKLTILMKDLWKLQSHTQKDFHTNLQVWVLNLSTHKKGTYFYL